MPNLQYIGAHGESPKKKSIFQLFFGVPHEKQRSVPHAKLRYDHGVVNLGRRCINKTFQWSENIEKNIWGNHQSISRLCNMNRYIFFLQKSFPFLGLGS